MKKSNPVFAFIIIGIAGTLWHFIYEWSGNNAVVGVIAPINESTWEHLKMLFFPTVIYSLIEFFLCKERYENYIAASAIGLFAGNAAITAFFYTYTGILGYDVSVLNVLSYYIGLFTMLFIKSRILRKKSFSSRTAKYLSLCIVAITAVLFGFWTFNPPKLGIFIPPVL